MLKTSTRLFAAGVLATTLVALNTGAFAHDHVPAKTSKQGAACCMMKAGATKTTAKAGAKTKLAADNDKDCVCCKKPASAKATKAVVKTGAKAVVKKS